MPTSNSIDALPLVPGNSFRAWRSPDRPGCILLAFPVLRAPQAALGLGIFALLCGLMPALGLAALLPLEAASATALLSLALIGGMAVPFIVASGVFAWLAVYLLTNSLRVEVSAAGVHTERRVFGRVTRRCDIARADIAAVEPRIGARHQNVFSATPRYALIAKHALERSKDVVVAEDLAGQPLMSDLRAMVCAALNIK